MKSDAIAVANYFVDKEIKHIPFIYQPDRQQGSRAFYLPKNQNRHDRSRIPEVHKGLRQEDSFLP